MPRNVFENHDEDEPKEVPLKLGVGGPVIGTATVDKDGNVTIGEITDPTVKQALQHPGALYSLADPADRYKVHPHQEEMDIPFGRPPEDVQKPFVENLPPTDPSDTHAYDNAKEWYRQNQKEE